jgi:predicted DNA-binding WGR domain protein
MSKRYFEFSGEDTGRGVANSAKFWEVTSNGSSLSIRFGKIGTNGQTTIKNFDTESAASAEAMKLIAAKVKKGYSEKDN